MTMRKKLACAAWLAAGTWPMTANAQSQLWIRQFGTSVSDITFALCPDGAGGAFIAGSTDASLGGPSGGGRDAWLARYDSAGNRTWIRQFGSSNYDSVSALCPGGAGGAFIAGVTDGSLGGPSAGFDDAWLARYDAPACYANCDGSTTSPVLTANDFTSFLGTGCQATGGCRECR